MKNLVRYFVFVGLAATLVFAEGEVYAQDQLLPVAVHMKIPMYVSDPKYPLNIYEDALGNFESYSRQNDTIFVNYQIQNLSTAYFGNLSISFIFDSARSLLKDFQYKRSGSLPRGTENFSIRFTSLKFEWLSDTAFYVADSGKQSMETIESASYYYFRSDNPPSTGSHFVSSDSLFRNDTTVRCYFLFQLLKSPTVSVQKQNIEPSFFVTFSSKHILLCSFANFSRSQPLLILRPPR